MVVLARGYQRFALCFWRFPHTPSLFGHSLVVREPIYTSFEDLFFTLKFIFNFAFIIERSIAVLRSLSVHQSYPTVTGFLCSSF